MPHVALYSKSERVVIFQDDKQDARGEYRIRVVNIEVFRKKLRENKYLFNKSTPISTPNRTNLITDTLKDIADDPSPIYLPLQEGNSRPFGYEPKQAISSGYRSFDVETGLRDLPDPYNIFPVIERAIEPNQTTAQTITNIAQAIEAKTGIPVRIVSPTASTDSVNDIFYFNNKTYGFHNPFSTSPNSPLARYDIAYDLDNNISVAQAQLANETALRNPEYTPAPYLINGNRVFNTSNKIEVLLFDKNEINNPEAISAIPHELGHSVELKPEFFNPFTPIQQTTKPVTEIMSSLYSMQTNLIYARKVSPEPIKLRLRKDIELFNMVLFGTINPKFSHPQSPTLPK